MEASILGKSIFVTLMIGLVFTLWIEVFALLSLKAGVSVWKGLAAGITKYLFPSRFFEENKRKTIVIMLAVQIFLIFLIFVQAIFYTFSF